MLSTWVQFLTFHMSLSRPAVISDLRAKGNLKHHSHIICETKQNKNPKDTLLLVYNIYFVFYIFFFLFYIICILNLAKISHLLLTKILKNNIVVVPDL